MHFLNRLFGQGDASQSSDSEWPALEALEKKLNRLDSGDAKVLAAKALLMGRLAYADSEISKTEKAAIETILQEDLGLNSSEAKCVTELSLEKNISEIIHTHHLVGILREHFDFDTLQIDQFLKILFRIACAEDISEEESENIWVVANGLGMTRKRFMELRSEFRDHLSVLKF